MKIGLISLGCPKNLVDSEVMLGLAQQAGHELTTTPRTPTCSSSTRAPSSTRPSRNRSTRSSRWPSTRRTARCQRLDRHRLPGRALPRRAAGRDSRDRRRARHRRSAGHRRARSAAPTRGRRRSADVLSRRWRSSHPARRHRTASTRHAPAPLPDLHLRRRHAAAAGDAAALRVREDRRGLRLQVRVLHHPDAARRTTAAGRPTRSSARRARSPARGVKELLLISQDTTFYGIDRGERGALARLLRELNAIDGLEWIRLLYLYPTTIDDDDARGDGRVREGLQVHRPAAAARVEPGAEADEAARARGRTTTGCSTASATACPASPCAPRSSSASPARPTPTSTSSARSSATTRSTTSACSPTRTRKARRRYALDDDVPAPVEDGAAEPGDEPAEAARPAPAARADRRARRGCWSTARPASTSWCCRAGWRRQAPDIDAVGLPDRVRPVELPSRAISSRSRSSGRADYDLIARPLSSTPVL